MLPGDPTLSLPQVIDIADGSVGLFRFRSPCCWCPLCSFAHCCFRDEHFKTCIGRNGCCSANRCLIVGASQHWSTVVRRLTCRDTLLPSLQEVYGIRAIRRVRQALQDRPAGARCAVAHASHHNSFLTHDTNFGRILWRPAAAGRRGGWRWWRSPSAAARRRSGPERDDRESRYVQCMYVQYMYTIRGIVFLIGRAYVLPDHKSPH